MANEYATLAQFKALPSITSSDSTDDALISVILTRASREIDSYCGGRRFFKTATETRRYNTPSSAQLDLDDDLLALTTLTNGDASVIAASNYFLDPVNDLPYHMITLKRSSGLVFMLDSGGNYEQAITVLGDWGYVDRSASDARSLRVISDTETACLIIAEAMYKKRYGQSVESVATVTGAGVVLSPRGIPTDAKLLIDNYVRLV
jgi:hypothetical protein